MGMRIATLEVHFSTSGDALFNVDYSYPGSIGSVIIPANYHYAYVTLTPLDDNLLDGDKSVTLTLQEYSNNEWAGYEIGIGSATASILDNEFTVWVGETEDAYEKDTKAGKVTFYRTGRYLEESLTINFAQVGGKAVFDFDYSAPNKTGSVTFAPYETKVSLTVEPLDEPFDDGDKDLIIGITPGYRYGVGNGPGSGTLSIIDDDDPIMAVRALDPVSVENPSTSSLFVGVEMGTPTSATLIITGSGNPQNDFTSLPTTLAGGDQLVLTPIKDDGQEPNERYELSLADGVMTLTAGVARGLVIDLPEYWRSDLTIKETDSATCGCSSPFEQSREYNASKHNDEDNPFGSGWSLSSIPELAGDQLDLAIRFGGQVQHFRPDGDGGYEPRISSPDRLIHDPVTHLVTLATETGERYVFNDMSDSWPESSRGRFSALYDTAGSATEVVATTPSGQIEDIQRSVSMGGMTGYESFLYGWSGDGKQMQSLTVRRRMGTQPWQTIERTEYGYFPADGPHGRAGDLMLVTQKNGEDEILNQTHYRYTMDPSNEKIHGKIKSIVKGAGFDRLQAAQGGQPSSWSDAAVNEYASETFQYDSEGRVSARYQAGVGVTTYAYERSNHSSQINYWRDKQVATLPNGTQTTTYTNSRGQSILTSVKPAGSTDEWLSHNRYDGRGNVVLNAGPEAISGYDPTLPDLLGYSNGNALYVRDNVGLITHYDYYSETTASEYNEGGVESRFEQAAISQGENGLLIPQTSISYFAHSDNAGVARVYPVASTTNYRESAYGYLPATTQYDYTWHPNTVRAQTVTTTLPSVDGGGGSASSIEYDILGRVRWMRDPLGYLTYAEYDVATAAMTLQIRDADTSQISTQPVLGWTTPANGGRHVISSQEVDSFGRPTKQTAPGGVESFTIYNDSDHEVRQYAAWNDSQNRPMGLTSVSREDRERGYVESLQIAATPATANGEPTGTEAIDNVVSLSRTHMTPNGQVDHSDAYFNLAGLSYTTSLNLGTEGVHFLRTRYGYGELGEVNRVESAAGTIYQTVHDGLGRATSEWIGTDDNSPTNLVQVRAYEYDNGGVGAGNLTSITQMPGGGEANRVTETFYDWRNRPVAIKEGVEASESTNVNRPITYTQYDNLDQPISSELYDGDGVGITFLSGVPERPSASLLRAKTTTEYGSWGRATRSDTFSVNPTNGAVSMNSLHSEVWFDERGLPIKSSSPGGLEEKVVYDGRGRATTIYTTDGGGGLTRGEGNNVLSDVVLSQSEIQYDDAGNVLLATNRERFHDANGIGPLGTATTGVPSRVSYTAMYYDKANRLTDSVDVGTHGGGAYTRPTSVPSRSDTALVSSVEYDAAGRPFKRIDPRGLESRTYYDLLSRTTKTIENYADGVVSDTDDKTTEFTYGPAGMTKLTAKTSPTTGQTTEWVYGVSTAMGSAVNSNDVVGATKWPDPSTGASSASEQETLLVNALGQPISTTDRNGNIHNFEYDILGRIVTDTVTTLGTGVDGGVRRLETAYDGQGNAYLLTSYDAVSGGNIVNQVKREFNGLGQLIAEWQSHSGAVTGSTPKVQYAYSEMAGGANHSRPTSVTYPNGRVVNRNYDAGLDNDISRLSSLSDGAVTLEGYEYLGLSSMVERSHPETGIDLSYIKRSGESNGDAGDQYIGLDRYGRIDDQRWLDASTGVAVDRYGYSYDRNGNRTERDNLVNSNFNETYTYDGLNQLSSFDRSSTRSQSWDYDALGNWDSVTTDSVTETRGHNEQNEITSVSGATTPTYDANGNMTGDETGRQFMYDAWNRLVGVKDSGGTTLTEYGYDAMNRRVSEKDGTTKDLYYSAGWQVLEEQVGGVTTESYVWSPVYVDAMIARDRDTDSNGTLDERLYVLHDANFNVTGLVDTSGNVVERFVYEPFGKVTELDAGWGILNGDGNAWRYLHQSGRLDALSGLYHFRNRDCSLSLGRWNKNDPIMFNAGDVNLLRSLSNNPTNYIDPSGLYIYIVRLLVKGGSNYVNQNFPVWKQADAMMEVYSKAKEANRRLAELIIPKAVNKALAFLKISGVKATVGDHVKANLTQCDFDKIESTLKGRLNSVATVSGVIAYNVILDKTWELKIYKDDRGEYKAAVGYHTDSVKHSGDALKWIAGEKLDLETDVVPNGENAEKYMGTNYYDTESLKALSNFKKLRCIGETIFDKDIK